MTAAIFAQLLPWLAGSVWTYWLVSRSPRWNWAIVTGHGYILGLFLATLSIRLWDLAGMELQFAGIAGLLAAFTLMGLALVKLKPGRARIAHVAPVMQAWQKAVVAVLLALLTYRYFTIFQEIILRPLFPWDAWMNWAPKAIVWFEHKSLVPFASQQVWLNSPADALVHIEGAKNAWKYPVGVPLVQLWGMLAQGTSDSTLVYLPWGFIALAMATAIYGHLKLLGHGTLLAVLACYLFLSLPFVNVHSALAGYADLWVTVAFGSALFALKEWDTSREWAYACLALVMATFCMQLKVPGLIMGGIIIALFISTLVPAGKALNAAALLLIALLAYVFIVGFQFTLPGAGLFVLGPNTIQVPYIGEFPIRYRDVNEAMINTLFLMINWNMLCYLTVLGFLALLWRYNRNVLQSLEFKAVVSTMGFILFVYYFTERYRFALDYTQVNRALIYATPVAILLLVSISRDSKISPPYNPEPGSAPS